MSIKDDFWECVDFPRGANPINYALEKIREPEAYRLAPVESLMPRSQSEARINSLSRIHGRGRQPPHTDGAHQERPPKFILLWSENATTAHATTHIRRLDTSLLTPRFWGELSDSVWMVRTSATRFHYRRAVESDELVRWDSGCFQKCIVGNLSANEVDQELEKLPAIEFSWSSTRALLLDNRRVLHGRSDATNEVDENRIIKRVSIYER